MTLFRLAALALAAIAAGCAIRPGTPAAELQQRWGAPAEVWKNADGSEDWEYPRGPLGRQTFMVAVGPDREVRKVRQVLSDEYLLRVRPEMSRGEVRRLLGRPAETAFFDRRDEEVWTWRYEDAGRSMLFHVVFDRSSGKVRTSFSIDESDSDGRDR